MPSCKTLFLALLAAAPAALAAAVTAPTAFRTSDGKVLTVGVVSADASLDNRLNASDRVAVVPPQAETAAADRVRKRDGFECWIPSVTLNPTDCNSICQYLNNNPLTVQPLDAGSAYTFSTGACTFAVTNRTPCNKWMYYGDMTQYCNDLLGDCVIYTYNGFYEVDSLGLAFDLMGETTVPSYPGQGC